MQPLTNTDHVFLESLAATAVLQAAQRFRRSIGLAYWGTAVLFAMALGAWFALNTPGQGLSEVMFGIALGSIIAGMGWWGRMWLFGRLHTEALEELVPQLPWHTFEFHARSGDELEKIAALRNHLQAHLQSRRAIDTSVYLLSLHALIDKQSRRVIA